MKVEKVDSTLLIKRDNENDDELIDKGDICCWLNSFFFFIFRGVGDSLSNV